jgi:hypothetical protein
MQSRWPSLIDSLFVALFFLAAFTGIPHAGVYDPTWEVAMVVDTGAIDISSSSGSAMEHTPLWSPWSSRDEWHLLYAKAGEIWHAALLPTGWLTPEVLSSAGGSARDPKLTFAGSRMIVVWEDNRRGHPEVWSRMWDGTTWTAEACLTDDAVASRMPVIAGNDARAYVAWMEGPDGQTQVHGRSWNGYGWQTVANVSASPAYAIEPSVTTTAYGYKFDIVWADTRHGDPEIYLRPWMDGFGTPVRLTDLTGSCRRPSAHAEDCCGDVIDSQTLIAFENDGTGRNETWTVCHGYIGGGAPTMISPGDARASDRPMVHGYPFSVGGDFGGVMPRFLITWTDGGAPGARQHPLGRTWSCPGLEASEVLSTQGLATSAISARVYDYTTPYAGLLAAWLEDRNSQRSLVIQRGSILSCQDYSFSGPWAILVSPGGTPGNTISCWDRCGVDGPAEGVEVAMSFTETLASHLTWDVLQEQPVFPPQTTGPDGRTNFALRGGGCWAGGNARVQVNGVEVLRWTGAKSPDVNGDCEVLVDDLAYVQGRLGTTDFCADLDGSGTVTQADVAIVQAAMGQQCSQIAGVDDLSGAPPSLQVRPNPSRGEVTIVFAADDPGPSCAEIFDAAGRLVRIWTEVGSNPDGGVLVWDGRDAIAREIPSGIYFIRVRTGAGTVSRAFLIAR